MAKASGLSVSTVHRIWSAFSLVPHRSETFKLSTDPQFVEKVRDVVGLYLDPPERALVLCVDEKSQIQAHGPLAASVADPARPASEEEPRLQTPRHDQTVRSARCGQRQGDRQPA